MTKKSSLTGLVRKVLQWGTLIIAFLNQLIELVNKVVNYARQIRKLPVQLQAKREAGLCA